MNPRLDDVFTWEQQRIQKEDTWITVRMIPDDKHYRFAVRESDGSLYEYESLRGIWCHVADGLYSELRRTSHMQEWYNKSEVPRLEDIERRLLALDIHFCGLLSSTPLNEQEAIQAKLFAACEQFGRVRDTDKRASKEQLLFLLPLRDSRGRVNPGVFLCRNLAAKDSLVERVRSITRIRPRLLFYQGVIVELIGVFDRHIAHALEALRTAYMAMGGRNFRRTPNHKELMASLRIAERSIIQLTMLAPFKRSAHRMLRDLAAAHKAATGLRYEEAQPYIVKIGHSLRIRQIRKEMDLTFIPMFGQHLLPHVPGMSCTEVYRYIDTELLPQLHAVDETSFDQPVCQDAITIIEAVRHTLEAHSRNRDITIANIHELREQVKQAARLL